MGCPLWVKSGTGFGSKAELNACDIDVSLASASRWCSAADATEREIGRETVLREMKLLKGAFLT
jgi:hypothetical protein